MAGSILPPGLGPAYFLLTIPFTTTSASRASGWSKRARLVDPVLGRQFRVYENIWILRFIRWQTVVDFVALAMALYGLLRWARQARALRIALGVVGLHAVALLATRLDLPITSWVLDGSAILAVVLLLLIFQPELRRAFMGLDAALRLFPRPASILSGSNLAIATAAFDLAHARLGALIVIVRRGSIAELLDGGVALEAEISFELLEAIFQKVSPLHDGAVIIEGNLIAKAGVVLPLTQRQDVPTFYGTRHRAGMGLAERSDALVLVVSEERGSVTLMEGGRIRQLETTEQLMEILQDLRGRTRQNLPTRIRRFFLANFEIKLVALALAGVIWSMSFFSPDTVRTVTVPVEFSNLPAGMEISTQSADTLEAQLRGSQWLMDSVGLEKLIARFDVGNFRPGSNTLRFTPGSLDLPPGIAVDRVIPVSIRIRLERSGSSPPKEK